MGELLWVGVTGKIQFGASCSARGSAGRQRVALWEPSSASGVGAQVGQSWKIVPRHALLRSVFLLRADCCPCCTARRPVLGLVAPVPPPPSPWGGGSARGSVLIPCLLEKFPRSRRGPSAPPGAPAPPRCAPPPPSPSTPHTSAPNCASRVLPAPPSSAPPASPFFAPGGPLSLPPAAPP